MKRVRLTESNLKHIIRESIKRYLNEDDTSLGNEFEPVYQQIIDCYDAVNEYYMNHGNIMSDGDDSQLRQLMEMMNKVHELAHEIEEHNAWD